MLSALNQSLANYIESKGSTNPFEVMLEYLLCISDSEYGFIGEISYDKEGKPFLQTHALTNIAWDESTKKLYDDNYAAGFRFTNLGTLFGKVMTTGSVVIANNAPTDRRGAGVPAGHPPLACIYGTSDIRWSRLDRYDWCCQPCWGLRYKGCRESWFTDREQRKYDICISFREGERADAGKSDPERRSHSFTA